MKTLRVLISTLLIITFSSTADVLWKPEHISFAIEKVHPSVGTGYILELNQALAKGETGWTQSRIDVPEYWANAKVSMLNNEVVVDVAGEQFRVNASNFGCLGFEILSAGKISDEELEVLWRKCTSGA